jgi:hypothetical protein
VWFDTRPKSQTLVRTHQRKTKTGTTQIRAHFRKLGFKSKTVVGLVDKKKYIAIDLDDDGRSETYVLLEGDMIAVASKEDETYVNFVKKEILGNFSNVKFKEYKTKKRTVSKHYEPNWTPEENQFIKSWEPFSPDSYYHGTSSNNLESVKRYGLLLGERPSLGATTEGPISATPFDMIGKIGLTNSSQQASFYARLVGGRDNKNPVVFDIPASSLREESLKMYDVHANEYIYDKKVLPEKIRGYWIKKTGWKYYRNPRWKG